MKTDFEIAREATLEPIYDIAAKAGISAVELEPYGKHIAKVPYTLINEEKVKKCNLILVTSITPTKSGNGKTTVSVGLALGMNRIGKNAVVLLVADMHKCCLWRKLTCTLRATSTLLPRPTI